MDYETLARMKQDDLARRAQRFDALVGPALSLQADSRPAVAPSKRRGVLRWFARGR